MCYFRKKYVSFLSCFLPNIYFPCGKIFSIKYVSTGVPIPSASPPPDLGAELCSQGRNERNRGSTHNLPWTTPKSQSLASSSWERRPCWMSQSSTEDHHYHLFSHLCLDLEHEIRTPIESVYRDLGPKFWAFRYGSPEKVVSLR